MHVRVLFFLNEHYYRTQNSLVWSADCYHRGERHVFGVKCTLLTWWRNAGICCWFDLDIHLPTSTCHSLLPTSNTLTCLVDRRGRNRWCEVHIANIMEKFRYFCWFDHDIHFPTSTCHSLLPTSNILTCLVDRRGLARCPPWQQPV